MDWARAKTILIIIFLLLNIFLLMTVLNNNVQMGFQSDYVRYATEYLQSRGIRIEAEISNVKGKMSVLAFGPRPIDLDTLSLSVLGKRVPAVQDDGMTIIQDGDESILLRDQTLIITETLSNGAELFQQEKAFLNSMYVYLRNLGIKKNQLSLSSVEQTEDLLVYNFYMKYKDFLLFEQPFYATISRTGKMTLTIPTREVKRAQSPREILSIYQILVMGQLPENSTILQVEFGYKKIGENDLYDSPVWRIRLDDGQFLYYNAYTGERVQ